MQWFAAAVAAITISRGLRGRPELLPSATILPHSIAARSSNERTRSWKSACGPCGPANHVRSSSRRRPAGIERTPRQISATVSVAMNRSLSSWLTTHSAIAVEGRGFRASLTRCSYRGGSGSQIDVALRDDFARQVEIGSDCRRPAQCLPNLPAAKAFSEDAPGHFLAQSLCFQVIRREPVGEFADKLLVPFQAANLIPGEAALG